MRDRLSFLLWLFLLLFAKSLGLFGTDSMCFLHHQLAVRWGQWALGRLRLGATADPGPSRRQVDPGALLP